jgi:putative tricarboxylic transport membrane protein
MKKYDLLGGLIWFMLGISLCIGSIKLKLGDLRMPGPGFMPFISGIFLGVFGLILTLSAIPKKFGEEEELNGKKIWKEVNCGKLLLTLIFSFGYGFLLEPLGFLITTFIFLFFLFKLTQPKRWVMPLVLSVGSVVTSYLFFHIWLKCQFPMGILRLLR